MSAWQDSPLFPPALKTALRAVTEKLETHFRQPAPHTPLPQSAMLEDLAVSIEELRVLAESLESQLQLVQEEKARSEYMFDAAPYAFLVTDREGVITQANRAAVAFLAVNPGRLVGKPLITFMPMSQRAAFRQHINDVGGGRQDTWSTWRGKVERPGSQVEALFRVRLTPHAGNAWRMFWIVRPIDYPATES